MNKTTDHDGPIRLGLWDILALLYLASPILLFLTGYFKAPFNVGLVALLLLCFYGCRSAAFKSNQITGRLILVSIAVAVLWTSMGGAGHFFYANHFDWKVRDAVLRDLLVAAEWPPLYHDSSGNEYMLRCPLAYYLVPAFIGQTFSLTLAQADKLLYLWTALGTFLAFALVLDGKNIKQSLTFLFIFPLFSGLDFIGHVTTTGGLPSLSQHLEWWAGAYQYSSNSTQLFWVPNHAIPGWLLAGLVMRHWSTGHLMRLMLPLIAIVPLWSPVVALALIPVAFTYLAIHRRSAIPWLKPDMVITVISCFTLALFLASYLTLQTAAIPRGWIFATDSRTNLLVWSHLVFFTLEVGLIAIAAWSVHRRAPSSLEWLSLVLLLLLPLYYFGRGNDLVMRMSIPFLMILCIYTCEALSSLSNTKLPYRAGLVCVISLAAITPIQEAVRALTHLRWSPRPDVSLIQVVDSEPHNYIARTNRGRFGNYLRKGQPVPSSSSINHTDSQ
jgi:hypothetical protein